jgi:hypothetical protein
VNAILLISLSMTAASGEGQASVLVVVGAEGSAEYGALFRTWTVNWRSAAEQAAAGFQTIGLDAKAESEDRDLLRERLAKAAGVKSAEPLWLVLIGHGTYDGRDAKFNLRGPDITPADLAAWLKPIQRPVILINCASASAPFLSALSGRNRVIITATRSGHELNFARFGQYFSEAIADPKADLDKDDQVSLLEAFLTASNRTAEYYRSRAQLATEHPLIDDTGDELGTPPDWFHGVHAVKRAKDAAPADGVRAHQIHLIASSREKSIPAEIRQRRDRLELEVAKLRDRKERLPEDDYFAQLEPLLVELAQLYRDLAKRD